MAQHDGDLTICALMTWLTTQCWATEMRATEATTDRKAQAGPTDDNDDNLATSDGWQYNYEDSSKFTHRKSTFFSKAQASPRQ